MKSIIATLLVFVASLFSLASAQEILDCQIATCEICNERFEQDMARNRVLTYAGVTAEFPTTNMTPKDFRDYDPNAGATYDATETGTVPATPFQVETKWKPLRNFGVTVTVGGNSRTLVRLGTEGSGQVGVDFSQGIFSFHSSDAGGSYSIAYRGVGAVLTATDANILQANLVATQVMLRTAVIGPASATDNAITRFDGTTGKLVQNSNATIDDSGNAVFTGTVAGSGLSGTNTGDVTLTTTLDDVISISGQLLGLQTQAANTVFAGPTSGGDAIPTFRALVDGDLDGINAFGRLTEENQWTGLNTFQGGLEAKVATLAPALVVESQGLTSATIETVATIGTRTSSAPANIRQHSFRMAANDTGATFAHVWPDASGTFVNTASSPLSIDAVTGNLTLGTVPIANGGTNSTATPTNGYYAKGDGSGYTFVNLLGTANSWSAQQTIAVSKNYCYSAQSIIGMFQTGVTLEAGLAYVNFAADATGLYAVFPVDLPAGTVWTGLSVKAQRGALGSGVTVTVRKRAANGSTTAFSTIDGPDTFTPGPPTTSTMTFGSAETVAADTVYEVLVQGGTSGGRLFDLTFITTSQPAS